MAAAAAAALGLGPSTTGHNFQAPPPPIQLPFPVYGLIPGFPHGQSGAAAAAASAHHQVPILKWVFLLETRKFSQTTNFVLDIKK
jgi:hypothetical protein